jgi:hypothetical protein
MIVCARLPNMMGYAMRQISLFETVDLIMLQK